MVIPPTNIPDHVMFDGKRYEFDCIAGTGDPIYQRIEGKEGDERLHVILVRDEA